MFITHNTERTTHIQHNTHTTYTQVIALSSKLQTLNKDILLDPKFIAQTKPFGEAGKGFEKGQDMDQNEINMKMAMAQSLAQ